LSFLGNYVETKITEATLSREMIRQHVIRQLRRPDFPAQRYEDDTE